MDFREIRIIKRGRVQSTFCVGKNAGTLKASWCFQAGHRDVNKPKT